MNETSDNYFHRLIHHLRTKPYAVGGTEAADAVATLWNIIEEAMQDTTENIVGTDGEAKGILSFSDLRMTWRAINRRGNLAYFSTRDDAAAWLRDQPRMGHAPANGNGQ